MRRRTHALVLVAGAAAVLLLSAPALGDPTLVDQPALVAAAIQHSPQIAVNPAAPSSAAVVADDGAIAANYPRTAVATTIAWPTGWTDRGVLTHPGSASAGQGDVAWGSAGLAAVEIGSSGGSLCTTSSGIFFSGSSDGGLTFDQGLPIRVGTTTTELVEPAIAIDSATGRIYVAYTELRFPTPGCSGTQDSSTILLLYSDNGGTSWIGPRRVSPLTSTGARSPALAAISDGRVVVAFRNDATPTPQIETETCVSPTPPGSIHYCGAGASAVGPSVVVGEATAAAVVSGLVGPPTPSVAAAGGRVTVAWHTTADTGVRAFATMSTDGGATFGPAQQIDPSGAGNQVAPQLASTAGGRVDAAYLWDTGSGSVRATAVSAGPPVAGAATEAWAQPVVVQPVGTGAATPIGGQLAPLGRGLGVATAAVTTPSSPLPATVVAYTDTTAGQDVRVVGLLHGTTIPVIPPQTVRASKNATTIVHVAGSDDDGDPLTWSTGAQPSNPASSVTVADASRGDFNYRAANVKGTDTFEAVTTDGVTGHEARTLINVNVVNDPPVIICPSLAGLQDTRIPVPVDACVDDANNDPTTVELDGATGGTVERSNGVWYFVPKAGSTAPGSFVLHASDGELTDEATVIVTIYKASGKVTIDVPGAGKRREIARGMSLRLAGHAQDAEGSRLEITWNFGDGTPTARGSAVAHRFRRQGSFIVKASAGTTGDTPPVQIRVRVRNRAVELIGTPQVEDGVMTLRVRTRAAGNLSLRVDSRSRTIKVPAGSTVQTLRIQVTTGPLVRLTLRLRPAKKTTLPGLSMRRLVLVSPMSAG